MLAVDEVHTMHVGPCVCCMGCSLSVGHGGPRRVQPGRQTSRLMRATTRTFCKCGRAKWYKAEKAARVATAGNNEGLHPDHVGAEGEAITVGPQSG